MSAVARSSTLAPEDMLTRASVGFTFSPSKNISCTSRIGVTHVHVHAHVHMCLRMPAGSAKAPSPPFVPIMVLYTGANSTYTLARRYLRDTEFVTRGLGRAP